MERLAERVAEPARVVEQSGAAPVLVSAGTAAVGLVFLLAASAKAASAMRFEMVVGHVLRGVGLRALPVAPLVVALVAVESLIGACYLLRLATPAVHRATLLVLAGFMGILVWMWVHPPAQGCGCIGFWAHPADPRREFALGFARNLGLVACIVAARGSTDRSFRSADLRRPRGAPGFTLVELLLVMSVVTLILALSLPALSRARRTARRAAELSDARQLFVALSAYSADQREFFPFCATPGDLTGPLLVGGVQLQYSYAYFTGQSKLFINLLHPAYLDSTRGVTIDDPGVAGAQRPLGVVRSNVWLTYTAFASPAYWRGENPPPRPASLLRGGRWSDLQFPSSKGLLLDIRAQDRQSTGAEPREPAAPWGIVWGDGSAVRTPVDLTRTYRTVQRPAAMFDWPVMATEGGLAGRDFEARPSPNP